jgi:2-methylisocitrate lyase-like PEP mutase family enzyme
MRQIEKATYFHALHAQESIFLIPNAWDALSARLFEQAGAQAIATTSAGVAAVFGYPDGEQIPKELFLRMIERIVASVSIPVSVDIEAGYGQTPAEISEFVDALLTMGVVGINLEDADPKHPGELFSVDAQVEKIRAIQQLAKKRNIPLFINARTDTYWQNLYDPERRRQETLKRLEAYQAAGASGVFIPGLKDPHLIAQVAQHVKIPINVLGGTWVEDLQALKSSGASRISIGSSAIRDVAHYLQERAGQLLKLKNCRCFNQDFSYAQLQALFSAEDAAPNSSNLFARAHL